MAEVRVLAERLEGIRAQRDGQIELMRAELGELHRDVGALKNAIAIQKGQAIIFRGLWLGFAGIVGAGAMKLLGLMASG